MMPAAVDNLLQLQKTGSGVVRGAEGCINKALPLATNCRATHVCELAVHPQKTWYSQYTLAVVYAVNRHDDCPCASQPTPTARLMSTRQE